MRGSAERLRNEATRGTVSIVRRSMRRGRLGLLLTAREGSAVVSVADDVPSPLVAAAVRHLLEVHAVEGGIGACRQPYCNAAGEWRPAASARAAAGG